MSISDREVTARRKAERSRVLELGASGEASAVKDLLPFLKSEFSESRRLAASALGKLAPVAPNVMTVAIALIPLALEDPHPQVQQYALKALGLYPKFAIPYLVNLKDLARNQTKPLYVRTAAAEAIAKIQMCDHKAVALSRHWCARCHAVIPESEFFEGMMHHGKPYCRHCLDEKQLEDVNFEATVESAKIRRTDDGRHVQSKGEKRIADYLSAHHIAAIYDERYRIAGDTRIRPDFYLPEFDLYIEYWGMDTPDYNENKERKLFLYQRKGKKLISLSYKDFDRLEEVLAEKLSRYIRLD